MISAPGFRPIVPVEKHEEWTPQAFLDYVQHDTRAWLKDDWHDIRPHLAIIHALALSVNVTDPREPIVQPPLCVEIGVRQGASTLPLLEAMRATNGKLVSFDIDLDAYGYAYGRVEAAELLPWWEPIAQSSTYADVPETIDLLFIDGDHSEEQAGIDFERFAPNVRAGGMILMHDYYDRLNPWDRDSVNGIQATGVPIVVEEARASGRYEVLILPWAYGLAILKVLG